MNDDNDRNSLIDFFIKINDLPKEDNPYTYMEEEKYELDNID